jgi:hypothetical protein
MAAFLLQLTDNEEEAFYIFISLISNTEYGSLYKDHLFRLKQFFYVLERLVALYMPELSMHLKHSGVSATYFSSPWFITLFSSCYQYISESVNPKILIRVWDDFILVNFINIEWMESSNEKCIIID